MATGSSRTGITMRTTNRIYRPDITGLCKFFAFVKDAEVTAVVIPYATPKSTTAVIEVPQNIPYASYV